VAIHYEGNVLKRKSYGADIHPVISDYAAQFKAGKLNRRDFIQSATRLGMSAGAAFAITGVTPSRQILAATPKKGGDFRVSMNVKDASDPAIYDWSEKGNVARHMCEPLVQIDANNIARPHLAAGWRASNDLKTWTFKLREGVTWSNGDSFGADDVVATVRRWLDPKTGSSNQGRFAAMTRLIDTGKIDKHGKPEKSRVARAGAVEKVDDHTVRFHLARPDLSLPESFADYPALITHRRFAEDGANLMKNPIGTGAFKLKQFAVGEKAVLDKRRDSPYWGGDIYLDRITYIDHGDDPAAEIGALASGQVDANYQSSVEQVDTIRSLPNLNLLEMVTAQTGIARMKVTAQPFNNKNIRKAVQACVDHDRILAIVYRGLGAVAEDHHVAPIHPEYAALPKLRQDYAAAHRYLAAAGRPNGIKLTIDCVANPAWEQNVCKALVEMCKPAGIQISINIMPGGSYWDRWMTTPFGFTSWTHRALGVQVLNLAYRSGVAWNETSYANPAFDALLDQAGGVTDANDRRMVMAQAEAMLQDDAIISQSFWRSVFVAANKRVHGLYPHVALEHHFNKVWLA
jgi:peptide/nickel transport system substrate-binding protein